MLTLDTSALYALLLKHEPDHELMRAARDRHPGPYIVPAGILAEIAYMLETRSRMTALNALLADLESGAYTVDCGERDFPRIRELANRYAGLRLGFSDSAVIACAERRRGRTLTADRRDFEVVMRGEKTITLLP